MSGPIRWTPRARRLGRAAQALGGGLLFAAWIVAVPVILSLLLGRVTS
jgi:hypothetical protein